MTTAIQLKIEAPKSLTIHDMRAIGKAEAKRTRKREKNLVRVKQAA